MGKPAALQQLEAIVHPLVAAEKQRWLAAAAAAGQQLVVLDIPLLYETGAEAMCDAVAVVSAPAEEQRRRALARPGMTEDKLAAILQRQVADEEKRRRADFVIDTVGGWVEGRRCAAGSVFSATGSVAVAMAMVAWHRAASAWSYSWCTGCS
jgi:dephospho-CoA kinase